MNEKQLERIRNGQGFIAALDQSGGSTPQALERYGVLPASYATDAEMYRLVHEMRTHMMTCTAFSKERIIGAILFEKTMELTVGGMLTADYLWDIKGIVPFLKIDEGLAPEELGVQLMKPISGLGERLQQAKAHRIFGTKERSLIKKANPAGIKAIVTQQMAVAKEVMAVGLVPIIEPEVAIDITDKQAAEALLKEELAYQLSQLEDSARVLLKLSLPTLPNFYDELAADPHVLRVAALSGGYSRAEACQQLAQNHQMIASFSRALAEGLTYQQTEAEFTATLAASIQQIYAASVN